MQSPHSYHVFALPEPLLHTLTPRNLISQTPPRSPSPPPPQAHSARTCNVCLVATFVDVDEQRNHYRSDWHRYNVKVRLNAGKPVTEADFTLLVDGLEDSISGSASSDEDSSNDSDTVAVLMSKTKRVALSPSPTSGSRTVPQTALAWFHSPPNTQIGVYKALFASKLPATLQLPELRQMQQVVDGGRKWAMFMVAGGHFAGAVVRVSKPDEDEENEDNGTVKKKKKPKKPKPDTEVLKHKTFHRYTTRRKQGGSQSLNDNAKGNAKSAGAQLRRYGEQSLREDIRNLLTDWADEINDCERIWIRASSSNRRIFLDYEEAVITKGDERLRTFPFPTRRPTQSELSRCLLELTRVKTSHLTEEALRAQDEAYIASLPKPKPIPMTSVPEPEKPKQPKLSKEEEALREKWTRLLEMVSKGRLDPLKTFWEREETVIGGVDMIIPEWTGERRGSLLQVASYAGHEDVTRWLLEEAHADPTVGVPVGGVTTRQEDDNGHDSDVSDAPSTLPAGTRRTAYDLARSRGVRNVFRRCAADHPDWWDWFGAARVPSALSKEMEEGREEKKKVRRKGLKDKVREREAREREKEKDRPSLIEAIEPVMPEPMPPNVTRPRKLGGANGAIDAVAGLTPEMRAKVERERRARAAEARLKALTGS